MNRLTAVLKDAVECRCRPNLDDIDAQNILFAFEDNYQLRAKVAELEAKLEKYQNMKLIAYRYELKAGEYAFTSAEHSFNVKYAANPMPLYALEMK